MFSPHSPQRGKCSVWLTRRPGGEGICVAPYGYRHHIIICLHGEFQGTADKENAWKLLFENLHVAWNDCKLNRMLTWHVLCVLLLIGNILWYEKMQIKKMKIVWNRKLKRMPVSTMISTFLFLRTHAKCFTDMTECVIVLWIMIEFFVKKVKYFKNLEGSSSNIDIAKRPGIHVLD